MSDFDDGWSDEVVVLPRAKLFELLGEFALPPWRDADGSLIGQHIDCAPIASTLQERIERIRL
ncbi:MAG TPA: hypothetical protein VGB14_18960 [Acidimicrobiales bacterium]